MLRQGTRFLVIVVLLAMMLAPMLGLLPALAQGGPPLYLGEPVSGEITSAAPEVPYTFEGRAGDSITIAMTASGQGLDSYLRLRYPDGTEVSDDDSGGNLNSLLGPVRLPVDGTYTVIATRFGGLEGNSTGPYTLVVNAAQVKPLELNETLTFDLNAEQPVMFFSYPGGSGQTFSLVAQGFGGDADFNINVRDANNGYVNGTWGNADGQAIIDPLVLGHAGDYMFVVTRQARDPSQASTASVRIGLTLRAIVTMPLAIGETVSGALDDGTPSVHYSFEAQAGDMLRLSGSETSGGQPFDVQVMNTEGYVSFGAGTAYSEQPGTFFIDPLTLDMAGTYLVVLRRTDIDGTGGHGLSQYTVTLGPTETPLLASGQEVTGSFSAGQYSEQVYRFEGTAGQVVRMTLRTIEGPYSPAVNWQGPGEDSGTMPGMGFGGGGYPGGMIFIVDMNGGVPGTATYQTTLPATGLYLFRVRNSGTYGPEGGPDWTEASYGLLVEVIQ